MNTEEKIDKLRLRHCKASDSTYAHYMNKFYFSQCKFKFYTEHDKTSPKESDVKEIMDIFESEFVPIIIRGEKEQLNKKRSHRFYAVGLPIKVDVAKAAAEFTENQEFPFSYIVENKLTSAFKLFMIDNKDRLKHKYVKRRSFSDYSHLAYNGVTEDF